ncbi:MAG: DegT/DnrJ/EryC1/StrS family aminotransferase [Lentisphaerae bacterium]|nr:DegT/DnrJ/EryC1/StrS family aminotransferase [Lentisphaerota bacterium]MCP4100704.1 DegT/DnrJ/EryC1/StrS family aminotransferase [Lentisphaerota bacterium]
MSIPQCSPFASYEADKEKINDAVLNVLKSGWYILGKEVKAFEKEFAAFCETDFSVGVANGTDAVELALRGLNLPPKSKIAIVSHTASATGAAIHRAGMQPVFVDIDKDSYTMCPLSLEKALLEIPDIKAIISVHLYGHPANMPEIMRIAEKFKVFVIEDCAQAHGAKVDGKRIGSIGVCGCFSFYPTKNLGAIGDGGAVTASSTEIQQQLITLRQYGWKERFVSSEQGINSRLDEIQAALLRVKLASLDAANKRRAEIAAMYNEGLKGLPLSLPKVKNNCVHVYHQYVITLDQRNELKDFLGRFDISTAIHYVKPLHEQPAFASCESVSLCQTESFVKRILSLPMYPEMTDEMVSEVIKVIKKFYK